LNPPLSSPGQEFNKPILRDLCESRREAGVFPADVADLALRELDETAVDSEEIQRILRAFLAY
jgi:hypothetical protein